MNVEKKVYFGLCSTASGTSTKDVILQGQTSTTQLPEFVEGDLLTVHFANGSKTDNITIRLSLQGALDNSTSSDTGLVVKIRGAEPAASPDWNFTDAWENGETKQFVYIHHPATGNQNGLYETYWEMLDGGNATTELYGDTKFLDVDDAKAWLEGDPLDDEDEMAISTAMIRQLLGGSDEEDPVTQLVWTQYYMDSNDESSEIMFPLGDMALTTDPAGYQTIYIPINELKNELGIDEQPWLERTAQLKNNGHLDTETNQPVYVEGYGYRGPSRYYIENYETTPVEFTNNFIAAGVVELATDTGKTLKVGGATTIENTLYVDGAGTFNSTLNAGVTTVSSLTSGPINGTTITASNQMSEYSTPLVQRYSPILRVFKHTGSPFNITTSDPQLHYRVNINGTNFSGYDTSWEPICVCGFNIDQVNSNNDGYRCYVWESFINGSNQAQIGITSTKNTTARIKCDIWILCRKYL